jgi:hypothetical protein
LITRESFYRYKIFEIIIVYDYNNLVNDTLEFSTLVFEISDDSYKFLIIDLIIILGGEVFFGYKNDRIENAVSVFFERGSLKKQSLKYLFDIYLEFGVEIPKYRYKNKYYFQGVKNYLVGICLFLFTVNDSMRPINIQND